MDGNASFEHPEGGAERFYRAWATGRGLCGFEASLAETDLQVFAERELAVEAEAAMRRVRRDIEMYAAAHDGFLESLRPLRAAPGAPGPVRRMCEAGAAYAVGPMAAVAGVVAETVGRELLSLSGQIIVENGGDVFFRTAEPPTFGLYAGPGSRFTGQVRFVPRGVTEGGVCTSSGTVGHSRSFGRADAVVTLSEDTALADAAATAIGNTVREAGDVARAIEIEQERGVLDGLVIAIGDTLGAWGALEIVEGA
jgi:hypothetical protein